MFINTEDTDVELVVPEKPKASKRQSKVVAIHLYMWCKRCLIIAAEGLHKCPYKREEIH